MHARAVQESGGSVRTDRRSCGRLIFVKHPAASHPFFYLCAAHTHVVLVATKHCTKLQAVYVVSYSRSQRCQHHGLPSAARPEADHPSLGDPTSVVHASPVVDVNISQLLGFDETSSSDVSKSVIWFVAHYIAPTTSTDSALIDSQLHRTCIDHRSSRDTRHEHDQCARLFRQRRHHRRLRRRRSGSTGGTSENHHESQNKRRT